MKLGALVVIFVGLCFSHGKSGESSVVISYDKAELSDLLSQHDVVLVRFSDGSDSSALASADRKNHAVYRDVAQRLHERYPAMVFAELQGSPQLQKKYDIPYYPAILLIQGYGRSYDIYRGDNTISSLVSWVVRTLSPAVKPLHSKEDVSAFIDLVGCVFLARFPRDNKEALATFVNVATKNRHLQGGFAWIHDPDATEGRVEVHHAADKEVGPPTLTPLSEASKITAFVRAEVFPLVTPASVDTLKELTTSQHPVLWFLGTESDFRRVEHHLRPLCRSVRQTGKEGTRCALLSLETYRPHALAYFGPDTLPALMYVDPSSGRVYKAPDFGSQDAIATFLRDIQETRLIPHRRAEKPIPFESNSFGRIVTRSTFEQGVFSNDRDTLLAILAPWDRYSQQLESNLTRLEEAALEDPEIAKVLIVAKLVGTRNDIQDVEGDFRYDRYPAMFFIKAGTRSPIRYHGPRSLASIVLFLEEHRSRPSKALDRLVARFT